MSNLCERPGPSGLGQRLTVISVLMVAMFSTAAFAHGDLHEQIVAISKRIRADPNDAGLVFRRAELYRDHEQWPEAVADYDRAEKLAPGFESVNLGRGKLYLATGKLDAARAQLDIVLKARPTHVDALATRAQVLQAQGEPLAAAADYAQAIANATSPEPDYYLGRAKALADADPVQIDGALATLDAGISRLGKLPTLSLAAIELEIDRGHFDAGLARLDAFRDGQSRQEGWLQRRGDLLAQAGRNDDAKAAWRDALLALNGLPPRLRGTGAMIELRARLMQRLQTGRLPPP